MVLPEDVCIADQERSNADRVYPLFPVCHRKRIGEVMFRLPPCALSRQQRTPDMKSLNAIGWHGILGAGENEERAVQNSPGFLKPLLPNIQGPEGIEGCSCFRRLTFVGLLPCLEREAVFGLSLRETALRVQ
jgi:hypothetical protein